MSVWLKLKQPTTVWNGVDVKAHVHKYIEYLSPQTTPKQMVANRIGEGSIHLVINGHGYFGPNIQVGTGITIDDLDAFIPLGGMSSLRMIWLSNCNITYFPGGDDFCFKLARLTGTYVVGNYTEIADVKPPVHCEEDTSYAMRSVFDPFGEKVKPSYFYKELADWAGFKKL